MPDETKLYAERDHMAQGEFYMRHVSAMTAEGLHAKSDIAGELAHRDERIATLEDAVAALREDLMLARLSVQQRTEQLGHAEAALAERDAAVAERDALLVEARRYVMWEANAPPCNGGSREKAASLLARIDQLKGGAS